MKLIIAGSRTLKDQLLIDRWLTTLLKEAGLVVDEVVSGGAQGVDQAGELWAQSLSIPITCFLPDWGTHGKKAGMLRNRQMAEYADGLVAFWDGKSRGTQNMIEEALKRGLKLWVITVDTSQPALSDFVKEIHVTGGFRGQ